MKKKLIILLTTMLAFASAASGAQIDNLAWNESNISWDYHWYPAGDGKYELAIGSASGPDVASLKIYWQDARGKFRSQEFGDSGDAGSAWYEGPPAGDF